MRLYQLSVLCASGNNEGTEGRKTSPQKLQIKQQPGPVLGGKTQTRGIQKECFHSDIPSDQEST